jgi:hypothetical protein
MGGVLMDPIYRKVVDEIFKAVVNPLNNRFSLDQMKDALAGHLEVYFIPRVDELLNKKKDDADTLDMFKSRIS